MELMADTRLALADVVRLERVPRVILMFEKLLSTSKLVRGDPFAVEPGLDIEPESLKIIVAIYFTLWYSIDYLSLFIHLRLTD